MTERNCPNCGEKISLEAIVCRFCDSGLSEEHFRECPYCCEMIRKDATRCRYCRSDVASITESENPSVIEITKNNPQGLSIAEEHGFIFNEILTGFYSNCTLGYLDILRILVTTLRADRAILWAIPKDHLTAFMEWSIDGVPCFSASKFTAAESTAFVLEFLSRFPDETGLGAINVKDTTSDFSLGEVSPTYRALLELSGVRSQILVQLRDQDRFIGILELQQKNLRNWKLSEAILLNRIAEFIVPRLRQDAR